ncbi:hypothetical protein LZ554_007532 [Drepanopeziza brunnea f. sp. 'monogermtubi']|nr:hypothetical protein LZ554_007532 [Drepanopeziza brunnea f. sp. 'monogermtubi']
MDTSHHRGRRPAPVALPEIYVHDPSERFRYPSRSTSYNSSSAASPREIPIPDAREAPPPPLPPPRYLADVADYGHNGQDIAWKWGNLHDDSGERGRSTPSIAPGSSLNGGHFVSRIMVERRPEVARSTGSNSIVRVTDQREISYHRDEGFARVGTSAWSNKSRSQESSSQLPSFSNFESSVHAKYQSNAQAFDKSQLQKLDARRGSGNRTPPPKPFSNPSFSSSVNDFSSTSHSNYTQRHSSQLKPLSLPTLPGRPGLVESPLSRCVETPPSSAISPKNSYTLFGMQNQFDHRPPSEVADYPDRSPLPYTGRSGSTSDDVSSVTSRFRDTYDVRVSPENDDGFLMEENGFRRLHIEDISSRLEGYSPTSSIGRKRRASSPPGEEGSSLHTVGSASELYRRRESASRASPTPRLHSTSGSVSSTASAPRNSSYASSLSVTGSSVTSMSSYGRLSPGGISPGALSAAGSDMSDSPYATSLPLVSSPRGSISRMNHNRALSEMRPLMDSRKLTESLDRSKHHHPPKIQRVFMCDCCPKKPKRFDTQDELIAHEQEKQYECAYCRNRFKNKNEAERHQNSLHLRRHSWSCAALSCYEAAFHSSPNKPNEADTCGYCGEDFLRSGISSPSMPGPPRAVATERDWKARANHLQEVHKFGECNHAKKFFRADHFRQHLKHSHAGTSGKWTNVLENSCMKDEPLPEPIRGPGRASPVGTRVGRINEEEEIP